ncbi:NAD(P)/FAD-dependent oxidoreductase [Rugamonas apoptosis]|uniref:NAD(P)/FAD-dependent oxidoreductase n=1 Tax=Rugamonas apoptosis TaxID=2758570 RepID=UPI001C71133F|nr:FAD-dependent oxidoreductase [Rugamonas apoptosis]
MAVIVGAGMAGQELAFSLRQYGWAGRIVLLGEEAHLPYRRPELSKSLLAAHTDADALSLRPGAAYDSAGIALRLNTRVASIDRQRRTLRLSEGAELGYDVLVLATGGRARRLPLEVPAGVAIHYLRGFDDAALLHKQFVPGKRLLMVGGGYVGLEVAALAAAAGLRVVVAEAMPRLLARVASPELSAFVERAHRQAGIELRLGATVAALARHGGRCEARLSDGATVVADIVVGGIGMTPEVALAEAAGLAIANGIAVDALSRTSDAAIYAIGDCCDRFHDFLSRRIRLESVPNASEQARRVAAQLTGRPVPASGVPWFWSNQGEQKIQIVGVFEAGLRTVSRPGQSEGQLSVFHLAGDRIRAAECVNSPADFAQARRLISSQTSVPDHQLADAAFPLSAIQALAACT